MTGDLWEFEEWTRTQRAALLAVLAVVVVSAGTGIALVPVLLTVAFVGATVYVGWWFYGEAFEG